MALGNAALFLALSFITSQFQLPREYSIYAAVLFFIGAVTSSVLMLFAGGALASVTFYVLGTGIFFGFGTAYSTTLNDFISNAYFSRHTQDVMLPTINTLNSLSATVALAIARPFCKEAPDATGGMSQFRSTLDLLRPALPFAYFFSAIYIVLQIYTFPLARDPLIKTFMGYLQGLAYCGLLASGATWSRSSIVVRAVTIAITAILAGIGVLAFSKQQTMIPLAAMVLGLLLDGRARRAAVGAMIAAAAVYFLLAVPISGYGRVHPNYSPTDNSIEDRIGMLGFAWNQNAVEEQLGRTQQGRYVARFAAAPVQSFLITQHDRGNGGDTLTTGWVALVPRIIWPDKPNVTRYGTELDGSVFRRGNSTTALAPSYTGEAYWNGGWLGVLIVSAILGLELGWLTRKWVRFTREGIQQAGIFVFGVPTIFFGLWVETWIVPTYVGGFVTLVVLITAADLAVRYLVPARHAPAMTLGRAGRTL